ncbi:hypothetical protein M0R72_13250 [Candidatus Pacearchaeota archaeon]|jgi:hypothetical protein|nr:hypothetical protein [Candidatus Pacearchaeota archaeon]
MKIRVPVIRTASDTPGPGRFQLSDIISEDSLYNLKLAKKRAAEQELKLTQIIVIESPTEIRRIMEEKPIYRRGER